MALHPVFYNLFQKKLNIGKGGCDWIWKYWFLQKFKQICKYLILGCI